MHFSRNTILPMSLHKGRIKVYLPSCSVMHQSHLQLLQQMRIEKVGHFVARTTKAHTDLDMSEGT